MASSSWAERAPMIWLRRRHPPTVAVLRLSGVIGAPARFRGGLSLHSLAPRIERAFGLRRLEAVALAINSPGGSPVQSALIHQRIRALAAEKSRPVFAFAEDVAASGGYWLACAGDEIYANETSLVGSIGVISSGFGFVELLQKIGVDRRLHTEGDKKALLDPFGPEKPADVKRLKAIQKEMHESFKALVRNRREGRLKGTERALFSGEFWTGARALELGLIDGVGDMRSVMRERYGERVRLHLIGGRRSLLGRVRFAPSTSEAVAGPWVHDLVGAVEARMLWSRYGL